MSLSTLNLDNRNFQQIVDEVRKRIPYYCAEWTDHNLSDPGITLVELFAHMVEKLLYQLNLVPELHAVRFMELLGVRLAPPEPARADITFWLSKPLVGTERSEAVRIEANTEVSTTQTEETPPTIYITGKPFMIQPPKLAACVFVTGQSRVSYTGRNLERLLHGGGSIPVFSPRPKVGDALYFGFDNDESSHDALSDHLLRLQVLVDPDRGVGINNRLPPIEWQVSTPHGWKTLEADEVDSDEIAGLNRSGYVQLHLPRLIRHSLTVREDRNGRGEQEEKTLDYCWVGVCVKKLDEAEKQAGMSEYESSPVLRGVGHPAAMGCTIPATQAQVVKEEVLGVSDGSPGQRFKLQITPVLRPRPESEDGRLYVMVRDEANNRWLEEEWTEREDFAGSDANSQVYTLDRVSGEVCFGPAIRQRDGAMRQYGCPPPRDARIVYRQYLHTRGAAGRVKKGQLDTLKSSIPYVNRVTNRRDSVGGQDAQTLDEAKMAVPGLLRARNRAVTADDYEFLARQREAGVEFGRVHCLQPPTEILHSLSPAAGARAPEPWDEGKPGEIELLVLPKQENREGPWKPEELQPDLEDCEHLRLYLTQFQLVGTTLKVIPPTYHPVSVLVILHQLPGLRQSTLRAAVIRQLNRYLNPYIGGLDGQGWPVGRSLPVLEIYQCLQGIVSLAALEEVKLFAAETAPENRDAEAVAEVSIGRRGIIISGQHEVRFVQP